MKPHLHCYTGKKDEDGDKTSTRVKLGLFLFVCLFFGGLEDII